MKHVAISETGHRIGEDHPNARYTDGEVEAVHRLRAAGWGYKRIAGTMEMPVRTVRSILSGERRGVTLAGWRRVRVDGKRRG